MTSAEQTSSRLMELLPSSWLAVFDRARVRYKLGRCQEALIDINTALTLEEPTEEIQRLRGEIRYVLGDEAGAQEDFDTAGALDA